MISRSLVYFATASTWALAFPALAQTKADAPAAEVEEVVVTGSRIQSTGYGRPTPVTVVTAQQLVTSQPAGIASALQEMPQFANSNGPRTIPANSGNALRGNFLNLRNLGINRSLILQDGVRMPPNGARGEVSIDMIPELLTQRVDVVTGGVSAVYGSDAVAGVVNFILDKKFTGMKAVVQGGVSDRNDLGNYRVGAAYGAGFMDDRAHLLLSFDRVDQRGINMNERPLINLFKFHVATYPVGTALPGGGVAGQPGTASNPFHIDGPVNSNRNVFGSDFTTGPAGITGITFSPNDAATPSVRDPGKFGSASSQVGGTLGYNPIGETMIGWSTVNTAFGRLSYDVTPTINTFLEFQGQRAHYRGFYGGNFATVPIFSGNAYLAPSLQAVVDATPGLATGGHAASRSTCGFGDPAIGCLTITGTTPELGLPYSIEVNKAFITRLGATADLGGDFKLDATYVFGQSRDRSELHQELSTSHTEAAVDAVRNPANGQIVCRVTLTNPGLYPGCVPWNPFGVRTPTQAQLDWLQFTSAREILNITHDVVANITGHPFSLWAGPVGMAIGGEYRTGLLKQTTNTDPSLPFPTAGIRGVDPRWVYNSNIGRGGGSVKVGEFNGEVDVPLLTEAPLAKDLRVTAAGRYTHYSTSGWVPSWKLGGEWSVNDALRLRITRSQDIRAPTLIDLFAGPTLSPGAAVDPHCGCQPFSGFRQLGGGNPDLVPEKGETFTVGGVVQPSFIPRLQVAVDYYHVKVTNAIATLTATQVLQDCEDANGTGPSCALITRPFPFSDRSQNNALTSLFAGNVNAALLETKGVDIDASYSLPLEDVQASWQGTLNLRLFINYTKLIRAQLTKTSPVVSTAGWTEGGPGTPGGVPKWRTHLSATYTLDPWSVTARFRYFDVLRPGPVNVYSTPNLPKKLYTDLTIARQFAALGTKVEGSLTVNNLFDTQPPLYPANANPYTGYPTVQALYDVIGRYYTAALRFRF